MKYILNGHDPIPCDDIMEWAIWFGSADRHVAKEDIGGVTVSTVFLGINHSFDEGTPILFETMAFGGPLDEEQERCSTWAEAESMHRRMVERVKNAAQA